MTFDTQALIDGTMVGAPVFIILFAAKWVLYTVVKRISASTETRWDDLLCNVIAKFSWVFFLALAIVSGWKSVDTVPTLVSKVVIIITFVQIARILGLIVEFIFEEKMNALENQNQRNILQLLLLGVKFIVFLGVLLACLDNLGIDVTALVTGLGIGGIAIALAVQSTLSDLLSSLSIILDRPFEVGDAFDVDGFTGTVEKIGIKTTRVRSTTGEEIVFPNSKLLSSQIRNFRRMDERRVAITIGVTYETDQAKLKAIPGIVKKVIEAQKDVRFDRAHFSNMGAYSLDFEIIYWVLSREIVIYRDVHQAILLDLFAEFTKQGIDFAYPTNVQYAYTVETPKQLAANEPHFGTKA